MTLLVSDEVAMAVAAGDPVVALETSVIGQGLPHPRNLECIDRMEGATRSAGAVPAWTGVVAGAIRAGLDPHELRLFAESSEATKVARRDIPFAVATGALGATTVSATIWTAHRAGIAIVATGGIGGVHPGMRADVSADLLELARTPVLLVCSGAKSIVDPILTAEKLEELGVALVGYGTDRLPFFLAREAPVELQHRVDTPDEAAAVARAQRGSGVRAAVLVCNPIPPEHAMEVAEVIAATRAAEERAAREGVAGTALTPFLLAAVADETGGRSITSNLALLEDNARVAAQIAVAFTGARSG